MTRERTESAGGQGWARSEPERSSIWGAPGGGAAEGKQARAPGPGGGAPGAPPRGGAPDGQRRAAPPEALSDVFSHWSEAQPGRRQAGAGASLPTSIQARFERSLGTDLGGVRLHTDAAADRSAQALQARAFTHGQDVYFGAGQYDPASAEGQELLAHEVAHTVQQRGAPAVQHKLEVSQPGDALEQEADQAAESMMTGRPAAVSTGAAPGKVSRASLRDKARGLLGPLLDKDIPSTDPLYRNWVGNPASLNGGTGCNSFTITYGNRLGGYPFGFGLKQAFPQLWVDAGTEGAAPQFGDVCEHNGGMNPKGYENLHVSVSLGGDDRIHAGQGTPQLDYIKTQRGKPAALKGWVDLDKLQPAYDQKQNAEKRQALLRLLRGTWQLTIPGARGEDGAQGNDWVWLCIFDGNGVRCTDLGGGQASHGAWEPDPEGDNVIITFGESRHLWRVDQIKAGAGDEGGTASTHPASRFKRGGGAAGPAADPVVAKVRGKWKVTRGSEVYYYQLQDSRRAAWGSSPTSFDGGAGRWSASGENVTIAWGSGTKDSWSGPLPKKGGQGTGTEVASDGTGYSLVFEKL